MNIQVSSLSHTFVNGSPQRTALEDVSFNIQSGQFVALIGPSGCGKTTLLRLAADLLKPSQGTILLNGRTPQQARVAGEIAWMAQSPALLPWLTAAENVALAQKFSRTVHKPKISVAEALKMVDLEDVAAAYPFTLSGGMQQRLALARLLALDASLWLMDEPFSALDEMTRERLTAELLALWQPLHPSVLWVTHNIYEALRLADRVLVFSPSPGRVIGDIPITLPRPRSESMPEFQQLLGELRALMAGNGEQQVKP